MEVGGEGAGSKSIEQGNWGPDEWEGMQLATDIPHIRDGVIWWESAGGNWGNVAHLQPVTATKGNNRAPHSCPDPQLRLANMKMGTLRDMHDMILADPFLNPDPTAHLAGQSNEALIIIDG